MQRAAISTVMVIGAGLFLWTCSSLALEPTPLMEATNCPEDLAGGHATCGVVLVSENHAEPGGRTIPIYVVRVEARQNSAREPLLILRGGPGIPAASRAAGDLERWRALNEWRDLIFVDSRGTGRSAPLDCRPQGEWTANFFSGGLTHKDVIRCSSHLAMEHVVSRFTTTATADDLDLVRRAFGYDRVAIFGASYGSYLAQVYAERYPRVVTRLILQAPVPLAEDAWAMHAQTQYLQARQTKRAILDAIEDCAANAECNAAYPGLEQKLTSVLSALEKEPVEVKLPGESGSEGRTMQLTKQHVLNLLHALLYDTTETTQFPIFVELLARGQFQPIAGAFQRVSKGVVGSVHWGLYLSIFCNEVYRRIDGERALLTKSGQFTTAEELIWGLEVCQSWPEAEGIEADRPHPPLDIPALILVGEVDPVIPPENVGKVRGLFPSGPTVLFANTAHSPAPSVWENCSVPLIRDFLSGSLDKQAGFACASSIRRPDFYIQN